MIKVKRIYSKYSSKDGYRILVDRLWPRGISKESAKVDLWLKEVGPTNTLRKWFSHDPKKWKGFNAKYHYELKGKAELVSLLGKLEKANKTITLLFSAKDENYNNAVSLKEFLETRK